MKTTQHWEEIFHIVMHEVDLILEVLDSRNPEGTLNTTIEDFIAKNKPQIQTIHILNKADMVPKDILHAWVDYLKGKNYEIITASSKYNRGIDFILKRLRILAKDRDLNILVVGYPNTGKSSLIEALTKNRKKVGVSSNAGFTRSFKKIKLASNLYIIDTPGVIPFAETDETEMAIKACMVADKLEDPLGVVNAIYQLLPKTQFNSLYGIDLKKNDTVEVFIEQIGVKYGRIRQGAVVDEFEVAKMIIRDWQSNKLRYYVVPPNIPEFAGNYTISSKNLDSQGIISTPKTWTTTTQPLIPPSLKEKRGRKTSSETKKVKIPPKKGAEDKKK